MSRTQYSDIARATHRVADDQRPDALIPSDFMDKHPAYKGSHLVRHYRRRSGTEDFEVQNEAGYRTMTAALHYITHDLVAAPDKMLTLTVPDFDSGVITLWFGTNEYVEVAEYKTNAFKRESYYGSTFDPTYVE